MVIYEPAINCNQEKTYKICISKLACEMCHSALEQLLRLVFLDEASEVPSRALRYLWFNIIVINLHLL